MFRRIQHGLRQDQPVGRDHGDIEPEIREFFSRVRTFLETGGMADGNALFFRAAVHGRKLQFLAAARRARRLRIDADDLMPARENGVERAHGEIRRAP